VSTFLGVWLLLGLEASFFALGREELNLSFIKWPFHVPSSLLSKKKPLDSSSFKANYRTKEREFASEPKPRKEAELRLIME